MRNEPFHERPWAELVFWLAMSAMLGLLAAWRFSLDGDWLWLGTCALGLAGVITMVVMVRRKLSMHPSRNESGNPFE